MYTPSKFRFPKTVAHSVRTANNLTAHFYWLTQNGDTPIKRVLKRFSPHKTFIAILSIKISLSNLKNFKRIKRWKKVSRNKIEKKNRNRIYLKYFILVCMLKLTLETHKSVCFSDDLRKITTERWATSDAKGFGPSNVDQSKVCNHISS